MAKTLDNKVNETKNILSFGKPFFTYVLLAVNILMFILLEAAGGSENMENLIRFGANINPAVLDGEWWRILSSMFLHIGLFHLFMNMLALYYLGTTVERLYGKGRFLIIYLLGGIGGGLASIAFTVNVSAGASGALFGLFGALLFFGLIYKRLFFQTMGSGLLMLIGINVIFGFIFPQIDNGAHLGGLIMGFVASAAVHLPGKRKPLRQAAAFLLYCVFISGLILLGIRSSESDVSYQLMRMDTFFENGNYEFVAEATSKGLENPGGLEAQLLFQRSFAYIKLDKSDLALAELEQSMRGKAPPPTD